MGLDYDEISQGRRRNWDPLKPEDIREAESKAKKEARRQERAERQKKKQLSYLKARDVLREEEKSADLAAYERAKRQALVVVAVFLGALLVYIGISLLVDWRRSVQSREDLARFEEVLLEGERVFDLATPVGALSSWRSAWSAGEIDTLFRLFSEDYRKKVRGNKPLEVVQAEYRRLYRDGRLDQQRSIAELFGNVEIIRLPDPPHRDGDLALFRSERVQLIGSPDPVQYIAAFSYNAKGEQWRFADVREAKYFSVRWNHENLIRPLQVGPRATTYDEDGNAILLPGQPRRTGP